MYYITNLFITNIAPPPGVDVPKYTGEIPENGNPDAAPSAPTAPPLEKMDAIPGYQNIGFDEGLFFPYLFTILFIYMHIS
jgi:hypothetical protein